MSYDSAFDDPSFIAFIAVVMCFVIVAIWFGVAWSAATLVTMQVQIEAPVALGQVEVMTISCTGRVRYDRMGRLHIIGGYWAKDGRKGGIAMSDYSSLNTKWMIEWANRMGTTYGGVVHAKCGCALSTMVGMFGYS